MEVEAFDFDLPRELIALRPAGRRDASRLFVLAGGKTGHGHFYDLPGYFERGDLLLVNDTRVLPVRLLGTKETGGLLEVVLVRRTEGGPDAEDFPPGAKTETENAWVEEKWEALYRGRYQGLLKVSDGLFLEFTGKDREVKAVCRGGLMQALAGCGQMPLPPYIKRRPDDGDKERYQTVYAQKKDFLFYCGPGAGTGFAGFSSFSIAAPTAGLHFTPGLLEAVRAKGVHVRSLTLHVGKGTFMPVKAVRVEDHRMEMEYFEFDRSLPEQINAVKAGGGRVFAVGTTTTRAIESFFSGAYVPAKNAPAETRGGDGKVAGSTDIFIHPGYRFKAVDMLVTNFHLPRSTPLMLAAAMAGRDRLLEAYREAVSSGYRFFSYGDAMLLEGQNNVFKSS